MKRVATTDIQAAREKSQCVDRETGTTKTGTKKTKSAKIVPITEFSVQKDVFLRPVRKQQTKTAKIFNHPTQNVPLYVQLQGGGTMPSFAYEPSQLGNGKASITINIGSDDEYKKLKEVEDEFKELCVRQKVHLLSPETKDDTVRDNFHRVVSPPKKKVNSDGYWNGTMKASVLPSDLQPEARGVPKCCVRTTAGELITDHERLKDMNWVKAVVEFSCLYTSGKHNTGVSKRFRYLVVEEKEETLDIVPL